MRICVMSVIRVTFVYNRFRTSGDQKKNCHYRVKGRKEQRKGNNSQFQYAVSAAEVVLDGLSWEFNLIPTAAANQILISHHLPSMSP